MIGAMLGFIPPARDTRELLVNIGFGSGTGLIAGYALAFTVAAGIALEKGLS